MDCFSDSQPYWTMSFINRLIALLIRLFASPAVPPQQPVIAPQKPPETTQVPIPAISTTMSWNTQKGAFHLTRMICDSAGLTFEEKNIICGCIYQESTFLNTAQCHNYRIVNGVKVLGSTDWGICQINDRFHIGPGKDFPSIPFVLNNPDKAVQWMVKMFKLGHISEWVSFSSGAYKKWLLPNSTMWKLGVQN